ncbi:MAG TPA: hypothetical protein VEQ66_04175 [Propionibacteriaceae bacterium]|nr:hypothetical protein [Propionibacteriaceae bacterium]
MTAIVLAMFIILGVAAGTAGIVVVGIEGRGRWRAPRLAEQMSRAAGHLNGEGDSPAR